LPLSTTLDSIGPLANSVACCAITDAILAGDMPVLPHAAEPAGLRLAIPRRSFLFDDLDAEVAAGFERACDLLTRAGARVYDVAVPELARYAAINAKGGFSPPESYAWHAALLARRGQDYDPRVRQRIARGVEIADRARFIAAVAARTADCDALVVPTVAAIAPPIARFAEDAEFFRLNGRLLRNPSLVNFLDRCAVTLPVAKPGEAPVGLMLIGAHGGDARLLAIAQALEPVLAKGLGA
jgi:aspartyl-tRNA(Asn)/glutamyl-tRNA(Gln) amidotransferase subunit A